ncbi:hypothetical protein JCM11641_008391 [Rhodosporidiobolus odoratus]
MAPRRSTPSSFTSSTATRLATFALFALATAGTAQAATGSGGETPGHASTILGGGTLEQIDPTVVNPNKPIVLIVIQLSLIIALSRCLAYFFGKMRQPRVVSEILAGILLGPTAFGRIPGFTEHIFPQASITYLTLLSEVGLVLFLFCVGMEADMGLLRRNLRPSLSVSLAGLAVPFGIGCAVSIGLFNQFGEPGVKFTTFMTFIGTSSSITALPVLARILGELQLMQDKVGLVALAAGVVNDVIGWALLALSIALANAGKGVVVVYILLTLVGWMLFLLYACRPALVLLAQRTGSYGPNGPTQNFVCACLVMVLASAFFCEVIGISAIFGGFLAGLIIPHHFCHPLTEKIEDLVTQLLVPLYFATSGLSTNLTLLNSGIIWAWTICVILCAFCGKFFGCAIAAKLTGFNWRESGATGALMSAKGLIELIVLNQGLQAGIISETVFSIFVLEALLLTIASTPLTLAFYPNRLRSSAPSPSGSGDGKLARHDGAPTNALPGAANGGLPYKEKTRFTVVLDQLESLGAAMVFASLFASQASPSSASPGTIVNEATASNTIDGTVTTVTTATDVKSGDLGLSTSSSSEEGSSEEGGASTTPARAADVGKAVAKGQNHQQQAGVVSLIPLRLVELTDRTSSALLAVSSPSQLLSSDALIGLFRTFTSLLSSSSSLSTSNGKGVRVDAENAEFKVEQQENWAEVVSRCAEGVGSEGVVVGWKIGSNGHHHSTGGMGGNQEEGMLPLSNPFSHLFPSTGVPPSSSSNLGASSSRPGLTRTASASHSHHAAAPRFAAFLRSLFLASSCDVSVLIDRTNSSSLSPTASEGGTDGMRLVVPFFGGADDRAALELAAQIVLRSNGRTKARVLVISRAAEETVEDRAASGVSSSSAQQEEAVKKGEGEEGEGDKLAHSLSQQYGLTHATHASQTHYPGTTAHPRTTQGGGGGGGLASETADSVLLSHLETLFSSSPSTPTDAFVVQRLSTAHPLKTMLRHLPSPSTASSPREKTLLLLGRSRRDAPSHRTESTALLSQAAKEGRLNGNVVANGEVRRAVGEPATAVLLDGGDDDGGEGGAAGGGGGGVGWVWVVQSRWTSGKRGAFRKNGDEA